MSCEWPRKVCFLKSSQGEGEDRHQDHINTEEKTPRILSGFFELIGPRMEPARDRESSLARSLPQVSGSSGGVHGQYRGGHCLPDKVAIFSKRKYRLPR